MSSFTEQFIERLKELRDQLRVYGLVMGGALVAIELVFYFISKHFGILNMILFFVIKVGTLFYVSQYIVKKIKPEFFKSGMNYAQSFSLILRLFLYGSLLVGLFTFVLNQWINPNYQTELINSTVNYIQSLVDAAALPDAQLELFEERIEFFSEQAVATPLQAMWSHIWHYITWGIFVGLILSIFMRDKDITPFSKEETSENV